MNLEQVKQQLLAARSELEARLQRTHKHTFQREEPVSPNFSEQLKQTENDSLVRALEEEGREELRLVNLALQRLESGDYLDCRSCGKPIGESRLQAIAHADLCIRCASAD